MCKLTNESRLGVQEDGRDRSTNGASQTEGEGDTVLLDWTE